MKLLIDNKLPGAELLFSPHATVSLKSGYDIHRNDLRDAEGLIIRSVTAIHPSLLEGTPIRWIGTATAGTDHMDLPWLTAHDIAWEATPGANAFAVADYVETCVHLLNQKGYLTEKTACVIGVGHVGSQVSERLKQLGFTVWENDPPRRESDPTFHSTPLEEALANAKLICLHTPLTQAGAYPTFHLLNEKNLSKIRRGGFLLNAGRGGVIDEAALLTHADRLHWVLDVWENEPAINSAVLEKATLATPHIAGATKASKWIAMERLYHAACKFFGWTPLAHKLTFSSPLPLDILAITHTLKHRQNFKQCREACGWR